MKLEKYQSFDQILIYGIAVDMAGWICIPFVTRAGGLWSILLSQLPVMSRVIRIFKSALQIRLIDHLMSLYSMFMC